MKTFWLIGFLGLAGCATPYQQMGFAGGVNASRITADTAQIVARGNSFTDEDTIQRYVLRRAAEETLADSFEFFRIGSDIDRTRVGSQSFGYATGGYRSAFGSAFSMPIIKPGQSLMIRMEHGPQPRPLPDGVFDAHEVLSYMVGTPYAHAPCKAGAPCP